MADESRNVETPKDFGEEKGSPVARWLAEIAAYNSTFDEWMKRAKKIVERYRDEREIGNQNTQTQLGSQKKFNILWSNVQTLQPALFSKTPIPDIERRYKDRDPVGLAAAEILERAVSHCLDVIDFETPVKLARDDYLLSGRGTTWERYVPKYGDETRDHIPLQMATSEQNPEFVLEGEDVDEPKYLDADGKQVTEGVKFADDGSPYMESEPYKPVVYEDVITDYISWEDFGHTPAPTWDKVRACWRKELMTRDQLNERFPKKGKDVGMTKVLSGIGPEKIEAFGDVFKRAEVYEIWDKTSRKVFWISPGYTEGVLDELADPLKLENFFPCPRPLYATMTGDRLIPVPDYYEYQDQANSIDTITQRLDMLVRAMKVSGAYDSSFPNLENIIKSSETTLVPVDNWAMFAEKGGIEGAISFVPLTEIAAAIQALSVERQNLKRDLYEITGLSDIIRGQGAGGRATATEQKIKGQFANLRLSERQRDVAIFVRDSVRIKSEIIAEHFSPETLLEISGWMQTATARALDLHVQKSGQGVTAKQRFDEAVALLKNDHLRSFRIDVETDSTVMEDAIGEKQARSEFLIALGQYLQQALAAAEKFPVLGTALAETLFFGVRGFRAGRHLEAVWEQAIEDLAAQGVQQPQAQEGGKSPAVEMAKIEVDRQEAQANLQLDQATMQLNAQVAQGKAQLAAARLQLEQQKLEFEKAKFVHESAVEGEKLGMSKQEAAHGRMIEEGKQVLDTIDKVGSLLIADKDKKDKKGEKK